MDKSSSETDKKNPLFAAPEWGGRESINEPRAMQRKSLMGGKALKNFYATQKGRRSVNQRKERVVPFTK